MSPFLFPVFRPPTRVAPAANLQPIASNRAAPDALHAATALHQNADLVLTNAEHFKRIHGEMPIVFLDQS